MAVEPDVGWLQLRGATANPQELALLESIQTLHSECRSLLQQLTAVQELRRRFKVGGTCAPGASHM
jgi:hypothetical protein